jgi:hypothetical protein
LVAGVRLLAFQCSHCTLISEESGDLNTRAPPGPLQWWSRALGSIAFSKLLFLLSKIDAGIVEWSIGQLIEGGSWSGYRRQYVERQRRYGGLSTRRV